MEPRGATVESWGATCYYCGGATFHYCGGATLPLLSVLNPARGCLEEKTVFRELVKTV